MNDIRENLHKYQSCYYSGKHMGLPEVIPGMERHFYIFPQVIPHPDPGTMLVKNRRLIYKIPHSEFMADRPLGPALLDAVDLPRDLQFPPYMLLPEADDTQSAARLNHVLATDEGFGRSFKDLQLVYELLEKQVTDWKSFSDGQCEYWEKVKVLFREERRDSYSEKLWNLEKLCLYPIDDENLTLVNFPLHHSGIWFGILCMTIDTRKLNLRDLYECRHVLLPMVSDKMYRHVYSEHQESSFFGNSDKWNCEVLTRIAVTNGLSSISCSGRRIFIVKRSDYSETETWEVAPQVGSLFFDDGQWSVGMQKGNYPFMPGGPNLVSSAFDSLATSTKDAYFKRLSLRKAAAAAVMSRNMSHNLGSHSLANSRFMTSVGLADVEAGDLSKANVSRARDKLQIFNQYCQGRLDFIARRLSEDGDRAEPLYFLADVMKGFMTQSVLLDTLLDDNGYRLLNIEFHIHAKSGEEDIWRYRQCDDGSCTLVEPETKFKDVLVGITGGMTGCHALYSIFENLLRNAAKYSRPISTPDTDCRTFELHVELTDFQDATGAKCYLLRLWDNLTNDTTGEIVEKVRRTLSKDLIQDDGTPASGGHGVQDMKLCSGYLAGALSFRDDDEPNAASHDDTDPLAKHSIIYGEFLNQARARKDGYTPLRAAKYRAYGQNVSLKNALVYEALLPKPVLIGYTCVGGGKKVEQCANHAHWSNHYYSTITDMAESSCYFGLIVAHDSQPETVRYTLSEIARVHHALPFRLMVVTTEGSDCQAWKSSIGRVSASAVAKNFYPVDRNVLETAIDQFASAFYTEVPILPRRRVHVISCNSDDIDGDRSPATWEELVLTIYREWVRAWKGEPPGVDGRWKMLIGFQRNPEQIESRWKESLERFTEDATLVDLCVATKTDADSRQWLSKPNGDRSLAESDDLFLHAVEPAASLIFDNHGAVFGEPHKGTRFYHKFGVDTLSLYQMLESPPSTKFGFGFYVYSLLEGCLLNVVTLDERVADSTLLTTTNGEFYLDLTPKKAEKYGGLRKCGVHTLYSMGNMESNPASVEDMDLDALNERFISPNVASWIEAEAKHEADRMFEAICREGIRFFEKDGILPISVLDEESDDGLMMLSESCEPDVVVVHEGITDSYSQSDRYAHGDHRRLYSILSAVVRTSGRGSKSRELGDELPFVELNILSDSCYGSMNKLRLGRALLNASGFFGSQEREKK